MGYYDRQSVSSIDYRQYIEKQTKNISADIKQNTAKVEESMIRMQTGVQTAINAQTSAIVASQAALSQTFQEGFDKVNNTLDMGFTGISNQLGYMTSAFSFGLDRISDNIKRMSYEICDRLYAIQNIASNPLLTQSQELYRRAIENYNKSFFEEALEDIQLSVEKNKTDYMSWFLMGKILAFGAGEFSNVIDLEKAINAFTQAAKYNSPYISNSNDARLLSSEIYFYLGVAQYSQSNELWRIEKKAEAIEMLGKALRSFEQSFNYSQNMLESLFNIARCKVLQGQKEPALKDLEKLILLDRNYCLKVLGDGDFSDISSDSIALINSLKQRVFTEAEEKYKKAISLTNELKKTNAPSHLYSIPPQLTNNLPYFDVIDYNVKIGEIIPQLEAVIPIYDKLKPIFSYGSLVATKKEEIEKKYEEDMKKYDEEVKKWQENMKKWQEDVDQRKKQSYEWESKKLCPHCGGKMSFFGKECKICKKVAAVPIYLPAQPSEPNKPDKIKFDNSSVLKSIRVSFGGINWIVLDIWDNKVLLLTERTVGDRCYHNYKMSVNWSDCDLRRYLNGEFLDKFNEIEKAMIDGREIFLLSKEEVLEYFGEKGQIRTATIWGDDNAMYFGNNPNNLGQIGCDWWLKYGDCVGGGITCIRNLARYDGAYLINKYGVRPALWLRVNGTAPSAKADSMAKQMIEEITSEPEPNKVYKGKVKSIQPFGAFVEILPGRDGLIHISEITDHRLEKVEDALHIGDEVTVLCLGVDPKGKVKLSIKALNSSQVPVTSAINTSTPAPVASTSVLSPMAGQILKIKVAVGITVSKNQEVLIMEAMKMECPIYATESGTVKAINVKEGEVVEEGQALLTIG